MFFALSGLINGLSATFLGFFVLSRRPDDKRHRIYALFCLCLSVWSYAYFKWLLAEEASTALFWVKCLMGGAIFIPPTAFHHLIELLGKKVPRAFLTGNYILSVLLFFGNWGSWITQDVTQKSGFLYWPNPGPLFHLHIIQFAALALLGLWILVRELPKSEGLRRNQIKFLILAELVGWSGGFTNYPLWYDVPILPYGNILISVYTGIFAYAMVRFGLMDIEVIVTKSLTYALVLLVLLLPCTLLVVWEQYLLFGEVNYLFSLMTLSLFILVGFLFPKFRFRTEEAFERVLFKRRHNYREALLRSSREMISVVELETLCHNLVQTVSKVLDVEKASLFLLDEANGTFDLKASAGLEDDRLNKLTLVKGEPLVLKLRGGTEALVREELEMSRNGQEDRESAKKMGDIGAEVSLSLESKDKLIGILNLGRKESKEMYSQEDLEVLSTLANQAAIAIENAQLYKDLKQSQTVLQRADRLSSLGLLTAGLAHEIRNPLVAIRTFTQLLPERYEDPEFRENFKTLALKEVDRICGLVNDLLSFARPSIPKVSPEDANELVEGIVRILDTEAKEKDVTLHLRLAPGLPKIFIDKEQIKQVFMNVVINAIQAIEGGGEVEVSTRMFSKDNSERFLQIEVRDSGIGIEGGDLENIFNPFFTTKKDGNGLGLSISHQIIQEHGGYMVADSKPGEGTAFYINLPAQLSHRPVNDMPGTNEKDLGH